MSMDRKVLEPRLLAALEKAENKNRQYNRYNGCMTNDSLQRACWKQTNNWNWGERCYRVQKIQKIMLDMKKDGLVDHAPRNGKGGTYYWFSLRTKRGKEIQKSLAQSRQTRDIVEDLLMEKFGFTKKYIKSIMKLKSGDVSKLSKEDKDPEKAQLYCLLTLEQVLDLYNSTNQE